MQIHRCRFADYAPQAINAIVVLPPIENRTYAAIGRSNGDIELWAVCDAERLVYEKTIPNVTNGSLEALAFSHQTKLTKDDLELFTTEAERKAYRSRLAQRAPRLFSAGLNAVIIEWDLGRMVPRAVVDSSGGAVWCMATNHAQTMLAVGTEDGHIRIFDISDGQLAYQRCFDKINSRILSVAWAKDDNTLVTGSADSCVRIWNVSDGHAIARMTLPLEGNEQTLVWAVGVTDDAIISGDSRGHVVFWDPVVRVPQQDIKAMSADILCLAVHPSKHEVYASGVDTKMVQFKLFENGRPAGTGHAPDTQPASMPEHRPSKRAKKNNRSSSRQKWQITSFRRYHTHDVRTIVFGPSNMLISAGVEAQIAYCSSKNFANAALHRKPCFPPADSIISVAGPARLVLQRGRSALKLWELGTVEPGQDAGVDKLECGHSLEMHQGQRELLNMELQTSTTLISAAISPSGHLVAASDSSGPKLFSIVRTAGNVKVRRLTNFPPSDFVPGYSENRGVSQMRFTPDGTRLVMATVENFVSIVDVSSWSTNAFTTVRRHCGHRFASEEVEADSECGDVPTHPATARNMQQSCLDVRTIIKMAVNSEYVATSSTVGTIVISRLDDGASITLPALHTKLVHTTPAAIAFDGAGDLTIIYTNNLIYVWKPLDHGLTEWSKEYSKGSRLPMSFLSDAIPPSGIAVNPAEPEIAYIWSTDCITRIDFSQAPGSRTGPRNIHQRKQIENEVYQQILDEKDALSKRAQKLTDAQKKQQADGDSSVAQDQNATKDPKPDSAQSKNSATTPTSDDWNSTFAARLREAGIEVEQPFNFRTTERYYDIMHASFVDKDTMLIIERPWTDVVASFPPAFRRHKFGG
ncbi:U3 small nucleolar RNA-associated protein [Coemansia sp. Benny D115]|nr:U3 small nucleolar RNA-associated protein [Coemansia sp. Benny D115]